MRRVVILSLVLGLAGTAATAQRKPLGTADPAATVAYQRTRLILKNGSYQMVLSYKVDGNVVEYRSAERNGELEEIPLKLVDMAATVAWYHEHVEGIAPEQQAHRPV